MNEMRKLMEAVQQLDEYMVQAGETVGEVFDRFLGMLDDLKRADGEEYEPDYLRSIGFEDAAESVEAMVDEVMVLKDALLPIWNDPITSDEMIMDLQSRAADHLEADYEDEDAYIETVLPSIDSAIDILGAIASGMDY